MDSVLLSSSSTYQVEEFFDDNYLVHYFTRAKQPDLINQDSLMILRLADNSLVLAVADGMGGHAGGAEASQLLLETIRHEIFRYDKGKAPLIDTITNGIFQGHRKIKSKHKGAGTTLCLATIQKNKVQFFSLGDSIGLVVSGKNSISYKTHEHSPVGFQLAAGSIEEDQAIRHHEKNLLDNVVGYDPLRMEVSAPIALNPRDSVIVMSDGIRNLAPLNDLVGKLKQVLVQQNAEELMGSYESHLYVDDLSLIHLRSKQY